MREASPHSAAKRAELSLQGGGQKTRLAAQGKFSTCLRFQVAYRFTGLGYSPGATTRSIGRPSRSSTIGAGEPTGACVRSR